MNDIGWRILANRWIIIFLAAGVINEIARFHLSPEEWVNFKVLKVVTIAILAFINLPLTSLSSTRIIKRLGFTN